MGGREWRSVTQKVREKPRGRVHHKWVPSAGGQADPSKALAFRKQVSGCAEKRQPWFYS